MSANILVPSIMRIGAGASLCLPEVLNQLGLKHPLIITGPVVIKYGIWNGLHKRWKMPECRLACFLTCPLTLVR